jgi:uncharacterized protein (UPF0548 family)
VRSSSKFRSRSAWIAAEGGERDRVACGVRRPHVARAADAAVLIVDGVTCMHQALAALWLWSEVSTRRWTVHTHHTLLSPAPEAMH